MKKINKENLFNELSQVVGTNYLLTQKKQMAGYCKGFRYGDGEALAVVLPNTLWELWQVVKCCLAHDTVMIVQAANTGITGGSTPQGEYDREMVIISTIRMNTIQPINEASQVIAFPGSRLFELEKLLDKYGREPHSVIGSSCIGASVVGGVCNNSGGALVQRGPAYTELSLFAQITATGELKLVNNLGIDLGESPEEILHNLQSGNYSQDAIEQSNKLASDNEYQQRVRDVDADTPSRFNQDKRRLFESSGCAGKLIVFAVRLDTFVKPNAEKTFYIGTNDTAVLTRIRRHILKYFEHLPMQGEYLHRGYFDVCQRYGKDSYLIIKHLGSEMMPKLFRSKVKVDNLCAKLPFMPSKPADKLLQTLMNILPNHLPKRIMGYRKQYEHHLILTMLDDGIAEAETFLQSFFQQSDNTGDYFICDEKEAQAAILNRFVAGGAAARYSITNAKKAGAVMSLDIALRRNDDEWFETLPPEIDALIDQKLYCGHFFCHVMHQDYVLKKGVDANEVKAQLLASFEARGAEYPAEHNVGQIYKAKPVLKNFYKQNDPTNTLNPGIGMTTRLKNWAGDKD